MRKALVGLCAACLLALLAAIPLSLALRAKRDWKSLYCSLVQERFVPWFKTQKNPEIFSFDWFDIHFSLFDLNGDGTPELFLDRAWWAGQKNASDLVGVYTVLDGKLRKFEEGPQERESNERYYLRSDWLDCGIGYQCMVTWYDFETCTLGAEVTDAQDKLLGLLEAKATAYGVAGGGRYEEFTTRTTWFRVAEWFNAPDPNAGPEITDNLPMSFYIRKDQIKGTADFRAVFTRAMEGNLAHSSEAYMPDPPYDTAAPASAAPRDNWRELYFEVLKEGLGSHIEFALFDLDGDGTPELRVSGTMYTVIDGEVRRFEPREDGGRPTASCRLLWGWAEDCGGGGWYYAVYYDFDTLTYFSGEGMSLKDIERAAAQYGGVEMKAFGPAAYIDTWGMEDEARFREVLFESIRLLEDTRPPGHVIYDGVSVYQVAKPNYPGETLYDRYNSQNTPEPGTDPAAGPETAGNNRLIWTGAGVIGVLSVLCAWALAMMRRAKRREEKAAAG